MISHERILTMRLGTTYLVTYGAIGTMKKSGFYFDIDYVTIGGDKMLSITRIANKRGRIETPAKERKRTKRRSY